MTNDKELNALQDVISGLEPLTEEARARVLATAAVFLKGRTPTAKGRPPGSKNRGKKTEEAPPLLAGEKP